MLANNKQQGRRWLATAVTVGVLALTGASVASCGKKDEGEVKNKATNTVTATTIQSQVMARKADVSGSITAWQEVIIGAETGGLTAVQVLADEGDYVKQGQLIVKMNDTLLRAQLQQQDAQVLSARASLAQAQAALSRARQLNAKGYLSQASLDEAVANQGTASAGVAAAEATRTETAARLDQTNLRAPVAGLISSRKVVKGQIVGAGTELFRLVRDGRLELAAEVPEVQLSMIHADMAATVSGDEAGSQPGVVRVVTPQVDAATRVGLARVSLLTPGKFRPGMFARATIDVGDQPSLVAPQAAVVFRNGKPGVFTLDGQNIAKFREVTTGVRVGSAVEILSGVQAGQRIAVQGAGFLADGDKVQVSASRNPAAPPAAQPAAPAR